MISIALVNTEEEILKANPNDLGESDKKIQRMRSRNQLLEKFYAGKTDAKYVKEYYEVLKKADKFIRTSTPHQMAVGADRHGMSYGMKDKYGRRYEHYGFFDEKHKNVGKTIGEVIDLEFEERRTTDDDFKLMYIFNNTPIEAALTKTIDSLENKTDEITVINMGKQSKQLEFPISIERDDENITNKLEELTEFLHIKMIGFELRQLEFFVPLKYKTNEIEDGSDIFNEIVTFKQLFLRDEYGTLIGFGIKNFSKRINYNDTHEVWKFDGNEMEMVGFNK